MSRREENTKDCRLRRPLSLQESGLGGCLLASLLSVRPAALSVWKLGWPSARAPQRCLVPRGLELRTLRLLAVRSDQLSYETHGKGRQPKSYLSVLHCPSISLDSICISLARLGDPHGPMQSTVQHRSTVVTPAHHKDVWSHACLNRGPYGY